MDKLHLLEIEVSEHDNHGAVRYRCGTQDRNGGDAARSNWEAIQFPWRFPACDLAQLDLQSEYAPDPIMLQAIYDALTPAGEVEVYVPYTNLSRLTLGNMGMDDLHALMGAAGFEHTNLTGDQRCFIARYCKARQLSFFFLEAHHDQTV